MSWKPALALLAMAVAGTAVLVGSGLDDQRFAGAPKAEKAKQPLEEVDADAPPARDTGPPPEVKAAADEWPLPHHDYANSRATDDAAIDSGNVDRLGVAWSTPISGRSHWGAAASAPVILDGTLYFQDLRSDVHAIDVTTGEEEWRAEIDESAFGPNGASVGYGRVYAQDGDHALRAFDLKTGEQAWEGQLDGPTGSAQPIPFGGMVYSGISAGALDRVPKGRLRMKLLEAGSSGWIYGLRAADGAAVWKFRTVAPGFWGDPASNSGGGLWYSPAVDAKTGATYWSTGNPAPGPGLIDAPNASSRPGPNLYTNTALAFDGRDGRKLWHDQLAPHDLFHHDIQNPPILVKAGGHDLVVASGKTGYVYAMDRRSGRLVWKRAVGIHRHDQLERLPEDGSPVWVWPGFWGGIEAPGAAAGGKLFFEVEDLPTPYTATAWGSKHTEENVPSLEGRTPLDRGRSRIVALDAASGRVLWQHRRPTIGFGGATVVDDLVFTASYDGRIEALRTSDGSVAWSMRAPAGIIAWPAVSGDTIVWPAGLGPEPMLFALKLGAGEGPPPAKARVEEGG
ncbi:MAG TPA: PQQ-binding-like beta-propeller repeat protein [Solirubrobacterales bacterium]|nr:PQQ-binding-like beta-propeller repeat protein [Solirubrobacterales bacterium]